MRNCIRNTAFVGLLVLGTAILKADEPKATPKPTAPGEALKTFKIADGLEMRLVASEPLIRQSPGGDCALPQAVRFDD